MTVMRFGTGMPSCVMVPPVMVMLPLAIFTLPRTCSGELGELVPMPTLPLASVAVAVS